jgi:hypothetical protein
MSGDPGQEVEAKVKDELDMEDTKLYPYLASLNPAQLKGEFLYPRHRY